MDWAALQEISSSESWHSIFEYIREGNEEVSAQLKFFKKRSGGKKVVRLKARATGLGPHQWPLRQEERGEKGQRFNLGDGGKGCGQDPGAEVWLETGLAAASPESGGGRRAASSGGRSGPGRAARPATGLGRGKRRGGGAAEEAAGLGVGRWGRAPMSAASGPEARGPGLAGGRPANRRRARRDCACARGPPRVAGGGGGAGGRGPAGWGRGREVGASHNNKPQPFPTPASQPPVSRSSRCTHSGTGSVRNPSGCGVGGWRVCRSLSPGGPTPARPSSGPSTRLQRPHFRFPCHSGKWLPEVPPHPARPSLASARFPFLRALGASPQVSCGAPPSFPLCSLSCPYFACSLRDLGLYLSFRCIPQSCFHITAAWRWHSGQCAVTSR